LRLLHFADVHLGMTNFGRLIPSMGIHSRVLEYLDALDQICGAAEDLKVDLIVFAGDAFRSRSPNPTLVTLLSHRIVRLANLAPVVMVVGNHDRQRVGMKQHSISIFDNLGAKYPIVVSDAISAYHVLDGVTVITLPWMYDSSSMVDNLECMYTSIDDAQGLRILVGHCTVETARVGSYSFRMDDETIYPLDTFYGEDLDYVALGHVHRHQCLCDDPPVVYSGSIQQVDWSERDYDHGYILADVSCGHVEWDFHKLDIRRMVQLNVSYHEALSVIRTSELDDTILRIHVHDIPAKITNDKLRHLLLDELESFVDCCVDGIFPVRDEPTRPKVVPADVMSYDPRLMMLRYLREMYDKTYATTLQRAALKLMKEIDDR